MSETKALVAPAAAAMMVLGAAAAAASDHGNGHNRGGSVRPCSLDGVNPAYHPDIFGNSAAAASYGFVRGPGGAWHVRADCSLSGR